MTKTLKNPWFFNVFRMSCCRPKLLLWVLFQDSPRQAPDSSKTAPTQPKTGPSSPRQAQPQDRSKNSQDRLLFEAKNFKKLLFFARFSGCHVVGRSCFFGSCSKTAQGRPKTAPRRHQHSPRQDQAAQDRPSTAQDRPKTSQDRLNFEAKNLQKPIFF